ncbi:MAG: hypothetical protein HY812_17185 [Planctomycetes bacterium]|nr:hypothetical protein [Planctomycetota bacterium]
MRFKLDENLPVGAAEVRRLLTRFLEAVDREPVVGRLWIVDERRIRIRGESR